MMKWFQACIILSILFGLVRYGAGIRPFMIGFGAQTLEMGVWVLFWIEDCIFTVGLVTLSGTEFLLIIIGFGFVLFRLLLREVNLMFAALMDTLR